MNSKLSHEKALNIILSHTCPNYHGEDEIGWEYEAHCQVIRIVARKKLDSGEHLKTNGIYQYEIVSLSVVEDKNDKR